MQKIIDRKLINLELDAKNQTEAINKLAELLYKHKKISSIEEFVKGVLDRERESTTGFGYGLAIPHCKSDAVNETSIVIAKNLEKLEWNSLDNKPVDFIILLAVPKEQANTTHLRILSQISSKLIDDEFREALKICSNPDEIVKMLEEINE